MLNIRNEGLRPCSFCMENLRVTVFLPPEFPIGVQTGAMRFALPHEHPYAELFVVQEGVLTAQIGDNEEKLRPGDALLVSAKTSHQTSSGGADGRETVLAFAIQKLNVQGTQDLYHQLLYYLTEKPCSLLRGQELLKTLAAFWEKCVREKNEALLGGTLYGMLRLLLDELEKQNGRIPPETLLSDDSVSRAEKIDEIINYYYTFNLSLSYLADQLYLSERQLSRIILNTFGQTFHQVIRQKRMKMAACMLRETELSVHEIGAQVGYSSSAGFWNSFRSTYGCTPDQFRKEARRSAGTKVGYNK